MSSTLTRASKEWASRPADQRFGSIADLKAKVMQYRREAVESPSVGIDSLRVEARDGDVVLVGKKEIPATLTNWSFGQVCRLADAPVGYMTTLPATLAAQNINHGLANRVSDDAKADKANILFQRNGDYKVRGVTTDEYSRIWNLDVVEAVERIVAADKRWQPAPAAFDGSRGLYASDRDMFMFMVDNDRRIFEKGPAGGLSRGFFTWNSEVGSASWGLCSFFYEHVCGNHRVWGATGVREVRIPHRGRADEKALTLLSDSIAAYGSSATARAEEEAIAAMHTRKIANTRDEVIDAVYAIKGRPAELTKLVIGDAYDMAVKHEDWYGDPRSVWGFTGGLTEVARDMPNTNTRTALDRAAGKIMQVEF